MIFMVGRSAVVDPPRRFFLADFGGLVMRLLQKATKHKDPRRTAPQVDVSYLGKGRSTVLGRCQTAVGF